MASHGSTSSFHVYILELIDGSYYVGHTSNLLRRIYEHQQGIACSHTKKIPMKRLLWSETQSDRLTASMREKEIKKWRREKKEALWQESSLP
jgi:predicted GIY-YIG superfamily endonuclease